MSRGWDVNRSGAFNTDTFHWRFIYEYEMLGQEIKDPGVKSHCVSGPAVENPINRGSVVC